MSLGASGKTYVYNPAADSWTTKASAPYVNNIPSFVTAVVDSKIYVIGLSGLNLIYDPFNDTWNALHSSQPYSDEGLMGYGLFTATAGATSGISAQKRIYVFYDNQTSVYQNANDTWTSGADLPNERVSYGLAVINDTFYVIGGGTYGEGFFAPYAPSKLNEQYFPIEYGTPDPDYVLEHFLPKISFLSPVNQTYNGSSVSLVFSVDKSVNWAGYSLDGQQNVTLTGNSTIANMTNGLHNITVYANDTFGNIGTSQTISFTVVKPEPFPTATVAAASIVVAVVCVGVILYFRRRKS
jgi:hypothetical protein